jgi:hypothetical protein
MGLAGCAGTTSPSLSIGAGVLSKPMASISSPAPTLPAPAPTPPNWYSVAEGAEYIAGAYPVPYTWRSDAGVREYLKVSYWGPTGSGPSDGQPDAMLTVVSTNAESASVDLSASSFTTYITPLIDGLVLPDSSGARPDVGVQFYGSGNLVLSRPTMPADCTLDDPTTFTGIQVAALGQNQRKYLISIDVAFADRSAERTARCAKAAATVPVDPNQPSPLSTESVSGGTEQGSPFPYVPPQPSAGPTPLTDAVRFLILAGLATVGLALFFRWRTSPVSPAAAAATPPVSEYGSDDLPGASDHHGHHPVGPPFLEWVRG